MNKMEMLKKIDELFKKIDELADYGLYSYYELSEIKEETIKNFKRIWNIK